MTKDEARKLLKGLRAKIPDREAQDRRIARYAIELAQECKSVFIYVSMGSEVSTRDIIRAFCEDKRVFVPYTTQDKEMHAVKLSLPLGDADKFGNTVCSTEYFDGQADITFVPLLGFDMMCNRLGYGAGCYDKYFEKYPSGLKVGLAYSCSLCEFDTDKTDIALDMIITPDGIIRRKI